jgi:anti-anti-sigma factor
MVPSLAHTIADPGPVASQFTVTVDADGVLALCGALDLATAPRLAEALRTACPPYGADLVVDVSGLAFCSCAGLTVLLVENRQRRAAGGELVLVGPVDGLRRLLLVTGADAAFNIRPTRPQQPPPADHHEHHLRRLGQRRSP